MITTSTEDMAKMVDAYLRAALWSTPISTEDGDCVESPFTSEDNPPLTDVFSFEDIVRATLDCYSFCELVGQYAEDGADHHPGDNANELAMRALLDMDAAQAGHDFWLTREGHGAGFWDRGLGVAGTRLSDAAKTFGAGDLMIYPDACQGPTDRTTPASDVNVGDLIFNGARWLYVIDVDQDTGSGLVRIVADLGAKDPAPTPTGAMVAPEYLLAIRKAQDITYRAEFA